MAMSVHGLTGSYHSLLKNCFGAIGAVTALSFAVECAKLTWVYFLRPYPSLKFYGKEWVVITGGSAGIGFEIAKQLVRAGVYNIVLIARGRSDLEGAKRELTLLNSNANIRIVTCDAADPDYPSLMKDFQAIESISMLFNNVGVHNDIPTNIEDMTKDEVNRIIAVNCNFQVQFTSMLVPKLKLATKSIIINISSLTSKMVMPMLAVYAATKAFEDHWSVNLAAELETHHIGVICLRPGITVSRMSGISTPSFFCPSASTMARACLQMIGTGKQSIAPYWPHALLDTVNALVPSCFSWPIVREMHNEKRIKLLKEK